MSFIASVALLAALTMPAAPISISHCSIDSISTPEWTGDVPTSEVIGSELHLSFVNNGSKAIRTVTFDVNEDGGTAQIKDVGYFSPGIRVTHYFPQGLLLTGGPTECRVASLEYAGAAE